jgi:hypothetical protein
VADWPAVLMKAGNDGHEAVDLEKVIVAEGRSQ